MSVFHLVLMAAALLNALVAGFLFAFAGVVMPGIRTLEDRAFLRAFGAMDRVIQGNAPVFLLVWVGSVVSVVAAAALGFGRLDTAEWGMTVAATLTCLLGVQGPTGAVNVPLNNRLQALDLEALDDAALRAAREAFEPRWNRWNVIRTVMAMATSGLLLGVVWRV